MRPNANLPFPGKVALPKGEDVASRQLIGTSHCTT